MHLHRPLQALLGLTVVTTGASAAVQSIVPLVREGDLVPGVGLVTRIDNLAIDDQGNWLVEADTDFATTTADSVLLRNGVMILREGQALSAPAGAGLSSIDDISLTGTGSYGANFFLTGMPSNQDSGLYFDGALVLQEGHVSTATGFSSPTPYIGFFGVKVNASGRMLVVASVDDPLIASSVDRALVLLDLGPGGTLLGETVLWKEGDILPGQTFPAADFGTSSAAFALDAAGRVLFVVDTTAPTTEDGAVYLDGLLLSQEGQPSPIAGRNWRILSTSVRLDLSATGGWVHTGTLDGDTSTDTVIVANGQKVAQEGDFLPSIAPFKLTSLGTSSPVHIDAGGNVVWWGQWDDPDTTRDSGWFRNGDLIVQEGVTQVGGVVLQALANVSDTSRLSDDGRLFLFEATLAGGIDGAFLMDVGGSASTYCTAKTNSLGCASPMGFSGVPSVSATAPFLLTASQIRNSTLGVLFHGFGAAAIAFQGGTLCVAPPVVRSSLQASGGSPPPAADCSGSFSYDFLPLLQSGNPAFMPGTEVFTQYWSRDPGDVFGTHLTDAVRFTVLP